MQFQKRLLLQSPFVSVESVCVRFRNHYGSYRREEPSRHTSINDLQNGHERVGSTRTETTNVFDLLYRVDEANSLASLESTVRHTPATVSIARIAIDSA